MNLENRLMNFAIAATHEWKRYTGLEITPEKVREIMNDDEDFYVSEVAEHYGYSVVGENLGLDTYPREVILDAISKNLVGMEMPCYGDHQDVKDKWLQAIVNVSNYNDGSTNSP